MSQPPSDPYDEYERMKSLYRLAIETRNFEITELVQRNNFFMIFQGVLLAGVMQASGGNPVPIVSFLICLCGLGVSLLQAGMAAGAKFWQERWEAEAEAKEKRILDFLAQQNVDVSNDFWKLFALSRDKSKAMVQANQLGRNGWFKRIINTILVNRVFSVSRIPIYVGGVFTFIWASLLLSAVQTPFKWSPPAFVTGFDSRESTKAGDKSNEKSLLCSTVKLNSKEFILCQK